METKARGIYKTFFIQTKTKNNGDKKLKTRTKGMETKARSKNKD